MLSSANIEKKVFKRKLERFKRRAPNNKKRKKRHSAGNEEEEKECKSLGQAEERQHEMEETHQQKLRDDEVNVEEPEKTYDEKCEGMLKNDDETKPTEQPQQKSSILTDVPFSSLRDRVSDATLKAVDEMGFERMTEIQAKSIPPLLDGKDVLGSAKTGSGKTLAFLIPAIELLLRNGWKQHFGTGVLIVSPTRELSMQTYGVLYEMMEKHPNLSHGLVMGGANRQTEAQRLSKGVSILVATPGRLLDHLQNTSGFVVRNLKCFVVDEADRIFDIGFEQEMHQIIKLLPKKRQSVLFSATCSPKVDELVKVALKTNPMKIGTVEPEQRSSDEMATVEGLEQGYVACPSEKRFLLLFTFLKKNRSKKIMVFFSSCASVKFHHELLNFIDLPVLCIHGKLKQQQRTRTFFQFCQASSGIMLCTDVAARGLDIPQVDWIVQYDPPDEPREYIHRVGRTARGDTGTGHALLILRPEELGFLRFLKTAKVVLNEYEFSWNKLTNIQPQLEKIISQNYYLNKSAREAYKGYIRAFDSHSLKQIYNVNSLDLIKVCKSFGFETPPFVDLPVANKPKLKAKRPFSNGISNNRKPKFGYVAGGSKNSVKPRLNQQRRRNDNDGEDVD